MNFFPFDMFCYMCPWILTYSITFYVKPTVVETMLWKAFLPGLCLPGYIIAYPFLYSSYITWLAVLYQSYIDLSSVAMLYHCIPLYTPFCCILLIRCILGLYYTIHTCIISFRRIIPYSMYNTYLHVCITYLLYNTRAISYTLYS